MQSDQTMSGGININTNQLFGINFFNDSKHILIHQYIKQIIKSDVTKKTHLLFTPNPEQVIESVADPAFLHALQHADICIPDGMGIVLASRYYSLFHKVSPIRERITGVDLMRDIITTFPQHTYVVLGGRVNDDPLVERELQVNGVKVPWLPAYVDASTPTPREQRVVDELLQRLRPDVVFIAFGAPKQEYWAIQQQGALAQYGVRLAMVVGGSVDVFAGRLQRAPKVMQSFGLEWLYRLLQEPWRWRRQLRLLAFVKLLLHEPFRKT